MKIRQKESGYGPLKSNKFFLTFVNLKKLNYLPTELICKIKTFFVNQAARKHLEEQGETPTAKREYTKRSISTVSGGDKEVRKRARKSSESVSQQRRESISKETMTSPSTSTGSFESKQIRANALKGIREALRIRIAKAEETKYTNEDLDKVEYISGSLF